MLVLVFSFLTVRLLRERITTEFTIISHENVSIGKGRSSPGEFIFKQWRRGFDQMHATQLPISGWTELRPDKVAFIGEKEHRRSVRYQVDTGSLSQAGNNVGLPDFTPGAGLKTNEQPSRARAVNKIISEKRGRSIAENAAGS